MASIKLFDYFKSDKSISKQYFIAILVGFVLTMITTSVIAKWVRDIDDHSIMYNHLSEAHWHVIFWGGVVGQLLQIGVILLIIFYA